MELVNTSPLRVEALPQQIRGDRFILTVILKGTFRITAGEAATLAEEQLPVLFSDELHKPEGGSLKFESDLAPFKPRADIVLVGHAHAPLGRPVTGLQAGLRVGELQKLLLVIGDRYWQTGVGTPSPSAPRPFTTMELTYERAYGGTDSSVGEYFPENPIGRGFVTKQPKLDSRVPLPNLEDPDRPIRSWQDRPHPAGFGFYAKTWQPRAGFLGTYDERWQQERAPDPPEDFRSDFFNGAHPGLQLAGYLRGDESVQLLNLTPGGKLAFRLPGLRPAVRVTTTARDATGMPQADTTERKALDLKLDTLCLLPDEQRCYLVWRARCPIRDPAASEVDRVEVGLP